MPGTFACLPAARGVDVIRVDPAAASLEVARRTRQAERVRELHGDSSVLGPLETDLATMTGHVGQVFLDDEGLRAVLHDLRRAVRPGGHVVFEVRDPERRGSLERSGTYRQTEVPSVGVVGSWVDDVEVALPFVMLHWIHEPEASGEVRTSESTRRFRSRDEVERALVDNGSVVEDVRDAPRRCGGRPPSSCEAPSVAPHDVYEVRPIGTVRSERTEPIDDDWDAIPTCIELDAERFTPDVVAGLDGFSHVDVVYLFHLVDEADVNLGARHPRGREDWPLVGILAQRAKARPNRIGVTTCRLLGVDRLTLRVEGLDAIDGTPVLDLKPTMAEFLPRGEHRQPAWASELMAGYW